MRSDRYKEEAEPKKKSRVLSIILVIIGVLLLATAGLVAYSYKTAKDSLSIAFRDNDIEVEFGTRPAAMDCVLNAEGDVSAAKKYLDTDSLGDKEMVYTVSKPVIGGLLKPSGEYTLRYSVVDSTPPMMIWDGNGTVLERGTEFDINKVIAYGDNADPEPTLKVDGKVNMNENGEYPLHVSVTDASGNETKWDLKVEVADSLPEYTDDSESMKFADFIEAHKADDGRSFGIDVSEWQHDIDFDAVKKAGCEFVIMRVGYNRKTTFIFDSKFDTYYKEAREAGLKVGLYTYSYAGTPEEVKAAADTIKQRLAGDKLDLPIAFDWEDFTSFQTYKMSFKDLNDLYDVFAKEMGEDGYDTMLYGSLTYLEKVWADTDKRPVWLAHYADKTSYKGPYMMWQASQSGRIAGIEKNVDMDILMPQTDH